MDHALFHLINREWTSPALDLFMAAMSDVNVWLPLLVALVLYARHLWRLQGTRLCFLCRPHAAVFRGRGRAKFETDGRTPPAEAGANRAPRATGAHEPEISRRASSARRCTTPRNGIAARLAAAIHFPPRTWRIISSSAPTACSSSGAAVYSICLSRSSSATRARIWARIGRAISRPRPSSGLARRCLWRQRWLRFGAGPGNAWCRRPSRGIRSLIENPWLRLNEHDTRSLDFCSVAHGHSAGAHRHG